MSGSSSDDGLDFNASLARVTARFANATQALHDRLLGIVRSETEQVAEMAKARLAELFSNPQRMQAAISTLVTDSATTIEGRVEAAGLPYLAIHEYGGVTRPHAIFPVNARALHFFGDHAAVFKTGSTSGTDGVFAKSVNHPGSVMPERSFMRYGLAQRASAIRDAFANAARGALSEDE